MHIQNLKTKTTYRLRNMDVCIVLVYGRWEKYQALPRNKDEIADKMGNTKVRCIWDGNMHSTHIRDLMLIS